jgi:hypothetical protein
MKHVKEYQELFEARTPLTPEQIKWLDTWTSGNWFRNPETGLVDIEGDFKVHRQDLTDFKGVRFGKVDGNFDCSYNRITSLDGAPQEVGNNFHCYDNQLTTLDGGPSIVKWDYNCSRNNLASLKGAPKLVNGYFDCSRNFLTSLEDAPDWIGGYFAFPKNRIVSLKGLPEHIGRRAEFYENPVSVHTLSSLYNSMRSGMSWEEAVEMHWDSLKNEEDMLLLASSNPRLSKDEIEAFQALVNMNRRAI